MLPVINTCISSRCLCEFCTVKSAVYQVCDIVLSLSYLCREHENWVSKMKSAHEVDKNLSIEELQRRHASDRKRAIRELKDEFQRDKAVEVKELTETLNTQREAKLIEVSLCVPLRYANAFPTNNLQIKESTWIS